MELTPQQVIDSVNLTIGKCIEEDSTPISFKIVGTKLEWLEVKTRPIAPKFPIGTIYTTRHKHPRQCRVIDVHRTTNHAGELVKVRYVSMHMVMDQEVIEYDVLETTIAMGSPKLP